MDHVQSLLKIRLTRFALAGAVNTAVSFVVLNVAFYWLHTGKIIAIILATGAAIIISYCLNRRFVFQTNHRFIDRFGHFVVIAALGTFIIQNSVYAIGIELLSQHVTDGLSINLSNVGASLAVATWNYHGYRLAVFHPQKKRLDNVQ
jgi:putative flippase GtrA